MTIYESAHRPTNPILHQRRHRRNAKDLERVREGKKEHKKEEARERDRELEWVLGDLGHTRRPKFPSLVKRPKKGGDLRKKATPTSCVAVHSYE